MIIKNDPILTQCKICDKLHRTHERCPNCSKREHKKWKRDKTRGEWP